MHTVDVKLNRYQLLLIKEAVTEATTRAFKLNASKTELRDLDTITDLLTKALKEVRKAEEPPVMSEKYPDGKVCDACITYEIPENCGCQHWNDEKGRWKKLSER